MDFARLCYLIERLGLPSLQRHYSFPATDQETVTLWIESSSSGVPPLIFSDYGEVGPIELWAVESVIDGMCEVAEWQS